MYVKIRNNEWGTSIYPITEIDLNRPNVNNGKKRGETAWKTKSLLFKETARW